MNANTIIISGGNTGIGKAIAMELAKKREKVIIISRDYEKGTRALQDIRYKTQNNNVELVQADLSSVSGCYNLADKLLSCYPELNILINNAGVWKTKCGINEDGLEISFMVNHMASFILSNLLLDRLKTNAPARIINLNAGLYFKGKLDLKETPYGKDFNKFKTYTNTKLCNVLFTKELAQRINGMGVTVNAVHPGVIRTNLGDSPGLFGLILKVIKIFWKSPAQGAIAPVWLAVSDEVEGVNGRYFLLKKEIDFFDNAKNEELQRGLWELSEKIMLGHRIESTL